MNIFTEKLFNFSFHAVPGARHPAIGPSREIKDNLNGVVQTSGLRLRYGDNFRVDFGRNIDANVFAAVSKRRHGQACIGSAIKDHARRRLWMGLR